MLVKWEVLVKSDLFTSRTRGTCHFKPNGPAREQGRFVMNQVQSRVELVNAPAQCPRCECDVDCVYMQVL